MSEISETPEHPAVTTERRLHPRHRIQMLAYVDLGEDNGGIVLNISEAGLALQAAIALADEELPHLRIQLPPSKKKVEASGRITWLSPTGKEAGVAFVNLHEDVRAQIKEWIILDSTPGGLQEQEEAEQALPVEEKIVEEQDRAAGSISEVSPAIPSAPTAFPESSLTAEPPLAPPPESVSQALPTPVPAIRKQAPPQKGPATFGSSGRRKPAAASAMSVAPAVSTPMTNSAGGQSSIPPTPPAEVATLGMEAGRGVRPLPDSAFALREQAPQSRAESLGKRRWWAFGGAVVSLAAISFAIGMLAGRGDLRGFVEIFGRDKAAARASDRSTGPSSANSDLTERSSLSGKNTDGPANNFPAAPQTQRASSQVLTLHRPRPGSSDESTSRQDSSAMVNLPEGPVSASASVAIRTRRSIPLPSESHAANSQAGQNLLIGALISKTEPAYPQEAQDQKIEGAVRLHAWIGEDGDVRQVEVLGGPPALATAASLAVRRWRYAPTLYDGQPIETEEEVVVVFRLPH
jgi:TonB family protein